MDTLLDRISSRHTKPEMRDSKLLIPETDINLWATCGVRMSSGLYRALWRYEARDGQRVIVCFALAPVQRVAGCQSGQNTGETVMFT
jgi:hypothetical protein